MSKKTNGLISDQTKNYNPMQAMRRKEKQKEKEKRKEERTLVRTEQMQAYKESRKQYDQEMDKIQKEKDRQINATKANQESTELWNLMQNNMDRAKLGQTAIL